MTGPVSAPGAALVSGNLTTRQVATKFARLRWQLLRGALRHGGAQRVGVVIGLIGAVVLGFSTGLVVALLAQTIDDPDPLLVVTPAATAAAIVALGIIAGVTQPIDPRIIAAEPLSDTQLAVGLLTASACGPPGIAAGFVGLGLFAGAIDGAASVLPVSLAALAFLATLLLISRSTVNALGLFANRFPRLAQLTIGLVSLVFYGAFQFLPPLFGNLDDDTRNTVADVARFTPPGQLGAAFATADESIANALGHVVLGSLWLPLLAWVFVRTTRLILMTAPKQGRTRRADARLGPLARAARGMCGGGPTGAIAWRSVLTRFRHPRTALETFVGGGIGLSLVLVPALTRDEAGASAVLVGGAVQLSVLFMAGNSIGTDGPAIGAEVLCGIEPETIIRAKTRAVVVVASPLAVVGPLIAAAITGEWEFLLAGVLVGIGGLFAGAGGAIVQSTFVPIAIPESDNPLAGGDSGQGILAAVVLVAVVLSLAITTLPVALALLWALDRGSVVLVSVLGVATVGLGFLVMRWCVAFAARRWRNREPEIYSAIIPTP